MKFVASMAIAAAIVLSSVNMASAADAEAAASPFEGAYVGAFGGFGDARLQGAVDTHEAIDCDVYDNSFPACPEEGEPFKGDWKRSAVYGAFAGYNIAHGGLILGVEADFGSLNAKDEAIDAGGNDHSKQEVNWVGSLRARVGMQPDTLTLVYGTAGVGYIDSSFQSSNNMDDCRDPQKGDCVTSKTDTSQFTPVVGAGVERFLTDNIALRLEGLYFLPSDTREFDAGELTSDMDNGDYARVGGVYQVRAGISWRF